MSSVMFSSSYFAEGKTSNYFRIFYLSVEMFSLYVRIVRTHPHLFILTVVIHLLFTSCLYCSLSYRPKRVKFCDLLLPSCKKSAFLLSTLRMTKCNIQVQKISKETSRFTGSYKESVLFSGTLQYAKSLFDAICNFFSNQIWGAWNA